MLTGKKVIFSLIIPAVIILITPCRAAMAAENDSGFFDERIYTRAEITGIEIRKIDKGQGIDLTETWISMKILDGELKGETRKAMFSGENDLPREMMYNKGDIVFVGVSPTASSGTTEYISIYDKDNTTGIIILFVMLTVSIIIIGRWKGVASLLALIVTIVLLFTVLIPMTLKGYPPMPIAVGISIISVLITLPIIAGIHLKTLGAMLGAIGGIILASLLAMTFGLIMHLSGIITNDMLTVFYASSISINLKGLVLSGMIISALGAVMDVCISISSSTTEIFNANPHIPEKEALKSVLNIGTDILGSMVNTLILAYVGSSLSLILIIALKFEPGMPFWMVLNYNPVLSEIVKSAIGSMGMFFCIPLTALISVKLHHRQVLKGEKP